MAFAVDGFFGAVVIFLFCYTGECVMTLSQDVEMALTQSNLVSFDGEKSLLKELKTYKFMLMRAQKPIKFGLAATGASANFGVMNLHFFSQTMNVIFSFIMFFRIVYNK